MKTAQRVVALALLLLLAACAASGPADPDPESRDEGMMDEERGWVTEESDR